MPVGVCHTWPHQHSNIVPPHPLLSAPLLNSFINTGLFLVVSLGLLCSSLGDTMFELQRVSTQHACISLILQPTIVSYFHWVMLVSQASHKPLPFLHTPQPMS